MIKLVKGSFFKENETKDKLIKFISNSSYFSFGEQCEMFEENFAKWQKRKYCVFLNSGSSANLAIIQVLLNTKKLKVGDKVGFSAITWSTNVMPLIQLGLQPIPIDIELNTLNISSTNLIGILKRHKIKMLFLTNLLGFCSDIDQIKKVCDEYKIILIEDNCESLGTLYKGKKLGNYGLASTFSFYVGHHLSTIEGGMVCTDSKALYTMLKIVRAHGWDRNLSESSQKFIRNKHKVNSTFYSRYTFYDLGYNLRPTEINGFIGNIQLQYINEIIDKRYKNFIYLSSRLYKIKEKYYPIKFDHIELVSNFAVPIICKTKSIRNNLVEKCKDKIEIRPIVAGDITRQPFYRKHIKKYINIENNSNAYIAHENGLYFGNSPELNENELSEIIKVFS